jgi:hypothetical protein
MVSFAVDIIIFAPPDTKSPYEEFCWINSRRDPEEFTMQS